jgi:hypothetical protein
VENDSHGVSLSGANPAYSMPELDKVRSAPALHWTMMDSKDHPVALLQPDDFRTGLHAGPLFRENELASGKIVAGHRKQERHLKRKHGIAVNILVKAVEVARSVLEKQGSRPPLPCCVALL